MNPPASDRLSRLLALVPWLIEHDGVTIDEASRHFGVTPKQLERDLWLVVCSGLPGHGPEDLIDIDFWDAGRIHVIDPQTLTRPLRLTSQEAALLLVGLRLLAQVPGDHDRDALMSATERLQQAAGDALPDSDRVFVAVASDPDAQQIVAEGIARGRALRLRYAGESRSEVTDRVVDPIRLHVRDGRAYLEAWCRRAEAVRTFRLDRMIEVTVLDEPITTHGPVPDPPDEGVRTPVTIDLDDAARWILESHACTIVGTPGPGRIRVRIDVADPRWLVRVVLAARGHAEVVDPPEVRRFVADVAAAALETYRA